MEGIKAKADLTAVTEKSAKDILDKQIELLSKASEFVANDRNLIQYLPEISHAFNAAYSLRYKG